MIFAEIIRKKRDGFPLTKGEIDFTINGFTEGRIPDYKMSALLMAIALQGMNSDEIKDLTEVMLHSGKTFDLSDIPGRKVDKHSTGGVGDKVSLVLAPLVASCGVIVPMISGRGLGHTGGTLDKLESIPGLRTNLTYKEFYGNTQEIGVAIMGQTEEIVPADRKMYSLRDVTGTVESIPLITASILSKKLAEGIDGLVLDLKCGKGAFMKRLEDAEKLASAIGSVMKIFGKGYVAIITNMDEPLGMSVGNSLEVIESIEALKGNGNDELMKVTYTLGSEMLVMGEKAENREDATVMLKQALNNGKALDRFRKMVELQGGNPEVIDDYSLFPISENKKEMIASNSGWISEINAYEIGVMNLLLGGGRKMKDDRINPGVGIIFRKKLGDRIEKGDAVCTIYFDKILNNGIEERFSRACKISPNPVEKPKIIVG